MLNDNIINYYLEFLFTSYMNTQLRQIDCEPLQALQIRQSPHHPLYSAVKSLFGRFLVFNSFFYSRITRSIDVSFIEVMISRLMILRV